MTTAKKISGAEKIIESFMYNKIQHVFVFPGGVIAPILDVIEKQTNIQIVCPRNEQGAGYAALSYAKITSKPAVFMVTSGPGVTNAITPIADAYYDNIPLIILTGQVGTNDLKGSIPVKQRGFQEVDTVNLVKPITKAVFQVKDVRELPDIMEHAFFLAQTGRKGPVVIDLPMDIQRAICETHKFFTVKKRTYKNPPLPKKNIEILANWVKNAKRPIILAGGGALSAGAEHEIRKLADRFNIPVAMSLPGIGSYPSAKTLSLGICGYSGNQHTNCAIYNSDLLLCIGTTLPVRQTGSIPENMAPQAKIVRIDIEKNELEYSRVPLDLKINADALEAITALNLAMQKLKKGNKWTQSTNEWKKTIGEWKTQYPPLIDRQATLTKPQYVIELIDQIVKNGQVIVSTGVGQHQLWVPRHFSFDYPKRMLLTSSGHGTMGFDLPAAIGAKIARPNATVLCFVGDGSLQMNIQELATIAEMKLDIKIIVIDNQSLNLVAQFQRQNWKSHPTTGDKYNPDFASIAKAYGIHSVTIKSSRDIKKALVSTLKRKEASLIRCLVDPQEDFLPMLLGGHTLNNMTFESSF